jgi:hypothetical protein
MYASITSRCRSIEKISVTLIDLPAAIISSIAGSPSFVPGILTYRFGLSISPWNRRASAIVASVSYAKVGSTSIET